MLIGTQVQPVGHTGQHPTPGTQVKPPQPGGLPPAGRHLGSVVVVVVGGGVVVVGGSVVVVVGGAPVVVVVVVVVGGGAAVVVVFGTAVVVVVVVAPQDPRVAVPRCAATADSATSMVFPLWQRVTFASGLAAAARARPASRPRRWRRPPQQRSSGQPRLRQPFHQIIKRGSVHRRFLLYAAATFGSGQRRRVRHRGAGDQGPDERRMDHCLRHSHIGHTACLSRWSGRWALVADTQPVFATKG